MHGHGAQALSIQKFHLFIQKLSNPLTEANFFQKVFCCMKSGEVEVNCY